LKAGQIEASDRHKRRRSRRGGAEGAWASMTPVIIPNAVVAGKLNMRVQLIVDS
jgi:hypothetical protein